MSIDTGKMIREARERAGLTQTAAAALVKPALAQGAWSVLECNNVTAALPTLERIAVSLGCELVVELRPALWGGIS